MIATGVSIRFPSSRSAFDGIGRLRFPILFVLCVLGMLGRVRANVASARRRQAQQRPRLRRPAPAPQSPVSLDRVLAVVNDEAITQYDMDEQRRIVLAQLKASNITPPSTDVLDKQVLERLITERATDAVRKGKRHPRRRHDGRAHDPAR